MVQIKQKTNMKQFCFPFIDSSNSSIALLVVPKLFIKRKSNKYLNNEY